MAGQYPQNTGNDYDDCVNAIANVLDLNKTSIRINEVLNYDPESVATVPSLAVTFARCERERQTLGGEAFFILSILCYVIYYHEDASKSMREKELRAGLYRTAKVLNENTALNGFCNNLGSQILSETVVNIEKRNSRFASGVIEVLASVQKLIDVGF